MPPAQNSELQLTNHSVNDVTKHRGQLLHQNPATGVNLGAGRLGQPPVRSTAKPVPTARAMSVGWTCIPPNEILPENPGRSRFTRLVRDAAPHVQWCGSREANPPGHPIDRFRAARSEGLADDYAAIRRGRNGRGS
jgi:hypothetical protein